MDKETGKFITKIVTLICGTSIALFALYQGYDGYLALLSVVALFGGEKLLEKLLNREK